MEGTVGDELRHDLGEVRIILGQIAGAFKLAFGPIEDSRPVCPNCRHNSKDWCWRIKIHARRVCTPGHSCKQFKRRQHNAR